MQPLLFVAALLLAEPAAGSRYVQPAAAEPQAAAPAQITILSDTPVPTLEEPAAAPPSPASDAAKAAFESPVTPTTDAPPVAPPATAEQPAAAAANQPEAPEFSVIAGGAKPAELMRLLNSAPINGRLAGVQITLGEAVRDAGSRSEQTELVKAYWNLSAAVTDYYLAVLDATELDALSQGIAEPGPGWSEAKAQYQARVLVTRRAAEAAQLELAQMLGSPAGSMPLPADAPHCGRYDARYDEIFATRHEPLARHLSEILTLRYEQLRTETQGVDDAQNWLLSVSEQLRPNSDGLALLQAHDLRSLRRRAFVATARAYNDEIAAYTELAAPDRVATDRLVAMMIRTTDAVQAPWTKSDVVPAGAFEPKDDAQTAKNAADKADKDADPKSVYGQGARTEVRRPLRDFVTREKSILTRIRRLRDPN